MRGRGKQWSDLSAGQRQPIVAAAAGELSLKVAALIDLRQRPRDQVRGTSPWVALMFVNLIGPVSYSPSAGRSSRSACPRPTHGPALLGEYAELVVMTGGDRLRARAYEKAARAVGGHSADISALSPAALQRIPGVGRSIAEKVGEIGRTGTFAALEALRADIPDGVLELTRIPALGPRRALQLYTSSASARPPRCATPSARPPGPACAASGPRARNGCCAASSCSKPQAAECC